uniref:LysR family transcriptional regulator n=1 Tax=Thaumasiovibrio occultus TaxID=1891184 RepID=UPI000B35A6AF|nr:LysR family transcriptional regulator [Thaumasiovibrio occultus]
MNKLLSFEALLVLDAIDRRGSFAAAADELQRAPSSLSYQVQKLEQDLDIVIFDRSGHKAAFTKAGEVLLARGRQLLLAADEMVADAVSTAHGWELDLNLGYDGILDLDRLLPLVPELTAQAPTRLHFCEEILAGGWEALMSGRVDLLLSPAQPSVPNEIKMIPVGKVRMNWVTSPSHPILQHDDPLCPDVRRQYTVVTVRDSALAAPPITFNVLDKQSVLSVKSMTDKVKALRAGLGIGTVNIDDVQPLIEAGELVRFGNEEDKVLEVMLAWKRSQMGKAKSWCVERFKKGDII